ncbi:MAG: hypothetical protein KR126chlam3_00727 [Chlamydiae bacterium]|nr:hypothetical protein [Chlamydiota bacterium]
MTLNIIQSDQPPIIAKHIGTVQDVIEGKIPQEQMSKKIDAAAVAYGFELATPKEPSSLGEAIMVGGRCYTTSTDENSSEYGKVIYGREFIPGGVFIIPHGAKSSHKASLSQPAISFERFYQDVHKEVKKPFAFVGLFHFETFHGTAISKPPIHGENIFSHKESYYKFPESRLEDVFCFVMGVAAQKDDLEKTHLETVLYDNPFDTKSTLVSHSHALLLNQSVPNIEDITPQHVEHCLHVFNEGTTIRKLEADLFTIQTTEAFS